MSELNEIHFGDWQGMTYKEIYEKYPKNGNNYFNNPKEYNSKENNGEDLLAGLERFLNGLMKIVQENQGLETNILVVTHGTVVELFLNYTTDIYCEHHLVFASEVWSLAFLMVVLYQELGGTSGELRIQAMVIKEKYD